MPPAKSPALTLTNCSGKQTWKNAGSSETAIAAVIDPRALRRGRQPRPRTTRAAAIHPQKKPDRSSVKPMAAVVSGHESAVNLHASQPGTSRGPPTDSPREASFGVTSPRHRGTL